MFSIESKKGIKEQAFNSAGLALFREGYLGFGELEYGLRSSGILELW